jgi:hypothetical protein
MLLIFHGNIPKPAIWRHRKLQKIKLLKKLNIEYVRQITIDHVIVNRFKTAVLELIF